MASRKKNPTPAEQRTLYRQTHRHQRKHRKREHQRYRRDTKLDFWWRRLEVCGFEFRFNNHEQYTMVLNAFRAFPRGRKYALGFYSAFYKFPAYLFKPKNYKQVMAALEGMTKEDPKVRPPRSKAMKRRRRESWHVRASHSAKWREFQKRKTEMAKG